MKKLRFLLLVFISLISSTSWSKSVWYCEWDTTVMIYDNEVLRTMLDGKKFKMQVDNMTVTFTKGSSLNKYSIKDTWGSGENWEFIAGNEQTVINFNEEKLYVASINRMRRITTSKLANCEKFQVLNTIDPKFKKIQK